MTHNLFDRNEEISFLNKRYQSKRAELIAVYGRRRVGKTHLIRHCFEGKPKYFELVGLKDGATKEQLLGFAESYSKAFTKNVPIETPKNWRKAFEALTSVIKTQKGKVVLFFDELPWLATRRSGLTQALDYYWNRHWSQQNNLKIIVCGSAASWMLDHLINARGGLYNRLTGTLQLEPFTLKQTHDFLLSRKIKYKYHEVLDLFMVTGGIPHYLLEVQKGKSVAQNLQQMCFEKNGILLNEFERLFSSLFDKAEDHTKIIRALATTHYGQSRKQLLESSSMNSGGGFNDRLFELEASGFIQKFVPYGKNKKGSYYRISDEYTLFYLKWIEPYKQKLGNINSYWHRLTTSSSWHSWCGFAFESVCYKHLNQIIKSLHLDEIGCFAQTWRYVPKKEVKKEGAQIDLLFERGDRTITICEIKYRKEPLHVDKALALSIDRKRDIFVEKTKTGLSTSVVLIASSEVKLGSWGEEVIDDTVTLEQLFKT